MNLGNCKIKEMYSKNMLPLFLPLVEYYPDNEVMLLYILA